LIKKEEENVLKPHAMWNVKTKVIPVTIETIGTVSK
jgi:hypothetical protein